jgi:hypothetical protein
MTLERTNSGGERQRTGSLFAIAAAAATAPLMINSVILPEVKNEQSQRPP